MAITHLKRDPALDAADPEWRDVRDVMQQILTDDDEQCLTLQFSDGGKPTELVVIRVNDDQTGEPVGWLTHYLPANGRDSLVLAGSDSHGQRSAREYFGAIADVPETCLVQEQDIQAAAVYFLQTGNPNPSQIWLDYFQAIHHH